MATVIPFFSLIRDKNFLSPHICQKRYTYHTWWGWWAIVATSYTFDSNKSLLLHQTIILLLKTLNDLGKLLCLFIIDQDTIYYGSWIFSFFKAWGGGVFFFSYKVTLSFCPMIKKNKSLCFKDIWSFLYAY